MTDAQTVTPEHAPDDGGHIGMSRHPSIMGVMRWFQFGHLETRLQEIARPFAVLAVEVLAELPDSAELAVCLRKLLEAKDCAVRAGVDAKA